MKISGLHTKSSKEQEDKIKADIAAIKRRKENILQAYSKEALVPFLDYQYAMVEHELHTEEELNELRTSWLDIMKSIKEQYPE